MQFLSGEGGVKDQGRAFRKPFSSTKCSLNAQVIAERLTERAAASGKTLGQSLKGPS
ncbi:MAG TPA: hypothetical protein VF316_13400 [Polyangiaceae bacterium]